MSLPKPPRTIAILLGYAALAVIETWPLALHLNRALPGPDNDAYQYLWNLDTFWHQIRHAQNPFQTSRVMYPIGVNLFSTTYGALPDVVGGLFLKAPVAYFNLLIMAGLVTAAFCAYRLIFYLTRRHPAAALGGVVYGFSPVMFAFILSQHFYFEWAAWCLPLGMLLVIRFLEAGRKADLAWCFALFWIAFFIDYYTAIMYLVITGLSGASIALHQGFRDRPGLRWLLAPRRLAGYAVVLGLTVVLPALVLALFVIPTRELFARAGSSLATAGFINANLEGFLVPGPLNPFLHPLSDHWPSGVLMNFDDTPGYFVGWAVSLLAVSAAVVLIRRNAYALAAAVVGASMFLLSLGFPVRWGDAELWSDERTLFWWFAHLPFMSLIDGVVRFEIGLQLAIAILIGLLLASLDLRRRTGRLVSGLAAVAIAVEYAAIDLPVNPVPVPAVYRILANTPDQRTVLELPSGIAESKRAFGYDWSIDALHAKQMYWQTIADKPRVGAYISRISEAQFDWFRSQPILGDLFAMTSLDGQWPDVAYTAAEVDQLIDRLNLGHLVLSPNDRQAQFASVVERLFGHRIARKQGEDGFLLYELASPAVDHQGQR